MEVKKRRKKRRKERSQEREEEQEEKGTKAPESKQVGGRRVDGGGEEGKK